MKRSNRIITIRSLLVGALFVVLFTVLVSYFDNRKSLYIASTQLATLPFALLFVMVLLLNPICRLLRVLRPFTVAEVLVVFLMGSVSAGLGSFGLAGQLVPVISGLLNEHWNNDQSEWNLYVEPFVNEAFFLATPELQEASREYHDQVMSLRRLKRGHDGALRLSRAQAAQTAAAAELADLQRGDAPDEELLERAVEALASAREARDEMAAEWAALREQEGYPEPETVLGTAPSRLVEQTRAVEQARLVLRRLEEAAFAEVAVFRRGLPESLRAFPGFVPLPQESFDTYRGRLHRLRDGRRACSAVREARECLSEDGAAAPAADRLGAAIALLEPLAASEALLRKKDRLNAEWDEASSALQEATEQLLALQAERRSAVADRFAALDRGIAKWGRAERRRRADLEDLTRAREQIGIQMLIRDRIREKVTSLGALRQELEQGLSGPERRNAVGAELERSLDDFAGFDASLRRFLVGDVPWRVWLRPLGLWLLVVGATYVVLMSFNVLIFRQWAYNERLVYPLAELPEIVAGHTAADAAGDWIPAVFRSGLFWVGFAVSAGVLFWNLLCHSQVIPGLQPLDLNNSWSSYLLNTPFEGLLPSACSAVFFTLIGLTFLVPANISFSLWFFWVLYMLQLLVLVWTGRGVNESSFPNEWWYTLNFRTAEGGGALMVFAVVVLYKCRRYLFCFFAPAPVRGLDSPEQIELRTSSALFVFGSIGLVLLLWLGLGANFWYTLFVYFVVMVITIGLVRSVAEGGILGFQAWVSPFHLVRSLFGMNKSWTSPSLFAPLMVYYSILFLDLKTFIAPAMANSIKIRDDLRMGRLRFHVAILIAVAVAVLTAVLVHVMLGYSRGADAMSSWFYIGFPRGLFDRISSMTKNNPFDPEKGALWMGFGAVLMAGLLYFRRILFWLPHPIGLIMLVNPIMRSYWFSIFLGWLAKFLVTKYGNKDTYKHVRKLFIGLIVGELVIVILAMILSVALGVRIPIDLNRN